MNGMLTQSQALLLLAAFGEEGAAWGAWERWRGLIDWDEHLDFDSFSLLPYIYHNLKASGATDPMFPKIKGIVRQAWVSNQYWKKELEDSLAECLDQGVEILFLPPTRTTLLDPETVANHQLPISCAVHPEQAEIAIQVLRRSEWKMAEVRLPFWSAKGYVRGGSYLAWERPQGRKLTLHWDLGRLLANNDDNIWARSVGVPLVRQTVLCLDDTDALAWSMLQNPETSPFGRVIAVLAAAVDGNLDWPRLQSLIARNESGPPAGLADFMSEIGPYLERWGAPAGFFALDEFFRFRETLESVPTPLRKRAAEDWRAFVEASGCRHAPAATLAQLPGYLMGRWQSHRLSDLPGGLWRWIRNDTKKR